ncbi:MAG: hypothetical protein M1820_002293 [Bogoriella megaspora]|nr:MAG: hypothetical protein M1820_002293 [Bogoriella megaspora]
MSRSPSLPSFRGKSSPCNSRLLPSEGLPKKSSPSFNNGRSPRSQLLAVPRGQQDISRRDPTPSARSSPYLDYPRYRDSPKNSCTPSPRRQTNGSTLLRASVRAADANEKRKIEEASRLPHSAPCTFNCSLSPLDQLEKAAQAELQKMSREMKQADEDMENKRVQRNTDCRYEFPNAMAMESSRDEPSEDKISDASSESEHLHTPFIVFNDHVPHDKQPQTPADLKRGPDFRSSLRAWARFRGVQAHDGSSTEGRKVSASRNQMPASEFSPGRNLSPSEQQPPASHAQVQQITSGIARTTHAGVVRSRHVFHGSNSSDPNKENSQEAEDIDGLSEERRTWMEREETSQEAVMDQTPPRLGRFERWMHE